jgi:phosphoglycerate dehydrogenase-like enzyme
VYGFDGLQEVMQKSDYVVTALPLTDKTRGLFNKDVFAQSKLNQVFINVGRGGLVVDEDLIFALGVDGPLLGAALDVFNTEPLPETSPYWDMQNVLISPHNADQTVDFRHRSVRFFTENCKRFIEGQELESVINLREGY